MQYINDKQDPQLLGKFDATSAFDLSELNKVQCMVDSLNSDLLATGFDQYQYDLVWRGDKVYVERV